MTRGRNSQHFPKEAIAGDLLQAIVIETLYAVYINFSPSVNLKQRYGEFIAVSKVSDIEHFYTLRMCGSSLQ